MQVKKFEAPTIQEALEVIKRELGPEAVILQTKKNKSGFGLMSKASVEVTAAVSDRSLQKKSYAEQRMGPSVKSALPKMTAIQQADLQEHYASKYLERSKSGPGKSAGENAPKTRKITATRYIDIDPGEVPAPASAPEPQRGMPSRAMSMEEEVRHLKRMIEELKSTQDSAVSASNGGAQAFASQISHGSLSTPALQDAFEQLVLNGMDKRYALSLIRKVGFEVGEARANNPEDVLDQVALEIMQTTVVSSPLAGFPRAEGEAGKGPAVIALVGPTGVGKTTTAAKIASEALLKRNLRVGLINLDSYKVAAFDQLSTYAKILNVPFRSVASSEDLSVAIQDFQGLDLVLIDTSGRSQRDPDSLKEMQGFLKAVPQVRTQLVLSVTTRDAELYDMASRFSLFRPYGLIASKLDEATIYGSIYNLGQKVKLPLLYFTTGQRVPEDIEEATPERVAALVLDL